MHGTRQGGFSQWFSGKELSRCAQIFTNAQYSHALQLPAPLILQEVAFDVCSATGTTGSGSRRSRSGSDKVPLPPVPASKEQSGPAGGKGTELFQTLSFQDSLCPTKCMAYIITRGKAGAVLRSPQPPGCRVTTLNEYFPNPAQLCHRSLTHNCEGALKGHRTPTSKTQDEGFTSSIPGYQSRYL